MSHLIRVTRSLVLASAIVATGAGAEIYYKWEKDGITQYTKERPRDIPSEEVRTMGGSPRSAAATTATDSSASAKPAPGTPAAAPVKKDPEICKRAKDNLETLQSRAIVRMKDEYGQDAVMDDKQRENELKKAQEAIKINC